MMTNINLKKTPLGKKSSYICYYDPSLLCPIPRQPKRIEIEITQNPLPFYGYDIWYAYELSWLNLKGKPEVAIARFDISCFSENIIESKSFKLYLNSFNQSQFDSIETIQSIISNDLRQALNGDVCVYIYPLEHFHLSVLTNHVGENIDKQDIYCNDYTINSSLLCLDEKSEDVDEILYSNLLKSNCLVTNQPDWGSIQIQYQGKKIQHAGLLKYIVSFRNHNEFHEQCVERIFMDIMNKCKPKKLAIEARYTRRGGLDINPIRSTEPIYPPHNMRMIRQ